MPKGTKILMVDDDKMLIDLYKERLELAGYTVEVSRDGEEGLAKIHSVKPDLVLLDIMMPKVNGYEALASIKSDPTTKDTPVIILSALMRDVNKSKAVESGADDYIIKSEAMPADVIKKIEAVLKKYHKEAPVSVKPSPTNNEEPPPPPNTPSKEIQFEPASGGPNIGGADLSKKPTSRPETPPFAGSSTANAVPVVAPQPPETATPAAQNYQPQKTSSTVVFLLVLIFVLVLISIASNIFLYLRIVQ